MVIDVIAAGLHPRVRSQADGSHYTSTGELPLVPGIDGVGRGADGLLRYFVLPDTRLGAMAEQTVIDTRRSIVLPEDADPIAVAAAMNPAMSSWVALRQRVPFQAGQNVLVLGATGNAGQMAIQVARRLGATQVIAAGRNAGAGWPACPRRHRHRAARHGAANTGLPRRHGAAQHGAAQRGPADAAQRLGQAAAHADVVIDYLWGEPTAAAMAAIVTGRADRDQPLTWIEIGSVAGQRGDPLRRTARCPAPDRGQRPRLRQHPGDPHGTARPRPGDHRRKLRDRRAAHVA